MEDNRTYEHKHNSAVHALSHSTAHTGNQSFLDKVISLVRNVFITYRSRTQATKAQDTERIYRLNAGAGYSVPEDSFSVRDVSITINSFNESSRRALSMYLSGYSYREIAQSMGLPLRTVKSRISEARCELQSAMSAY